MALPSAVLPEIASVDTFLEATIRNFRDVEDPSTDIDARYINRWGAQLAMESHVVDRAWAKCLVAGAAVAQPADGDHGAVWGNTSGVRPTAVRVSAGIFTLTWAATYDDLQSTPETHAVSFKVVEPSAYNGASFIAVTASVTSANVVTVRTFDAAGAAADPTEFSVKVR